MTTELIQICTTVADRADAKRIAAALVAKELAACVQISGPVESTFRWQGRVDNSQEWVCSIKTRRELYGSVESAIRELHSYDEPEIIAFPIELAASGYQQWIVDSVRQPGP